MKPYPPLGILYICSHLRQKGVKAEVFDSTFSSRQELWDLLKKGPPSVLGVYANLMTRSNVIEILRVAKECGWQTIVGGPEPGAYVKEYLTAGADVVVIGEGEVTLEELVPALQSGNADNWHQIDGIAFRAQDGSVVRTKPREQIKNIDTQPWPARESIDMARYVEVWREHHGMGSVSLITARGCPYHCRWCSHEVFGKTHRRRTPASVADELQFLVSRYQPQMAWMADDVFTIHHGWLFPIRGRAQATRIESAFRMHLACRSVESPGRRHTRGHGLFPRLDRLRKRLAANSRRHGTRGNRRTSADRSSPLPIRRNSNRNVFDVGLRRRGALGY